MNTDHWALIFRTLRNTYRAEAVPAPADSDTHVHRMANRLGWLRTREPDQTKKILLKILPKKYEAEANDLLAAHGRKVCLSVSPGCSRCKIAWACAQRGVVQPH